LKTLKNKYIVEINLKCSIFFGVDKSMNFLKTFLISLAIYLGLNAVFMLISMFLSPSFPSGDILYIIASIFLPIGVVPSKAWLDSGIIAFLSSTDYLTTTLVFLGAVVPPLASSIVAARLGDSLNISLRAWLLTAILSTFGFVIFIGIGQSYSPSLIILFSSYVSDYGYTGAYISIFIIGILNAIFYSGVLALLAKKYL